MDGLLETVTSGALWAAVPIAFVAGIVAFLSPCVLPLAPGYISYITGLTGAELADPKGKRGQVLLGSLLFVLGFSVVFVSYGVLFGGAGALHGGVGHGGRGRRRADPGRDEHQGGDIEAVTKSHRVAPGPRRP